MSTLKPWEEGYTPPKIEPFDPASVGHLGGKKTAENRAAGIAPKPSTTGNPPGVPRTNPELQEELDAMVEETISLKMKTFLDRFVHEYLYDMSIMNAFIRAGGNPSTANNLAYKYFRTGYMQNQLRMVSEMMDEEKLVTNREIILGLKKEANHFGEDSSPAARVKAWTVLGKIKGLEAPKKTETTVTHKGGVMMVPAIKDVNEWEGQATMLQGQLKQDVRN